MLVGWAFPGCGAGSTCRTPEAALSCPFLLPVVHHACMGARDVPVCTETRVCLSTSALSLALPAGPLGRAVLSCLPVAHLTVGPTQDRIEGN